MITLSDVITFGLLSRFFSNLLNKILIIAEKPIWIGVGSGASSVMTNFNKRNRYVRGTSIQLTASNSNIVVVYPSSMLTNITVIMSNVACPMTVTTETINEVEYKVLKSANTYDGTFNVSLV